jgi:hypothetical protein
MVCNAALHGVMSLRNNTFDAFVRVSLPSAHGVNWRCTPNIHILGKLLAPVHAVAQSHCLTTSAAH